MPFLLVLFVFKDRHISAKCRIVHYAFWPWTKQANHNVTVLTITLEANLAWAVDRSHVLLPNIICHSPTEWYRHFLFSETSWSDQPKTISNLSLVDQKARPLIEERKFYFPKRDSLARSEIRSEFLGKLLFGSFSDEQLWREIDFNRSIEASNCLAGSRDFWSNGKYLAFLNGSVITALFSNQANEGKT